MLKFFFVCSLILTSFASFASPIEYTMSMKERIRLSLWMEGLESQSKTKSQQPVKHRPLPEEIERPLRKL